MGAFKFRGAYNAMSRLAPDERQRGVLRILLRQPRTGGALAGKLLGIASTIVMPADAPAVKLEATRGYGAEVVLYDKHKEVREEVAERVAREDASFPWFPPFDHAHVIAGQGTATRERFEEVGPLDYLVVPVSGGGADSGLRGRRVGIFARLQGDRRGARGGRRRHALPSGRRRCRPVATRTRLPTGAQSHSLGRLTFRAGTAVVHDMVTVRRRGTRPGDVLPVGADEIVSSRRERWARAGPLRARTSGSRQRVGVILSGGNVDLKNCSLGFV